MKKMYDKKAQNQWDEVLFSWNLLTFSHEGIEKNIELKVPGKWDTHDLNQFLKRIV